MGGWSPAARGPARAQAGDQWRQGHRDWDQGAPWRQNHNWWQGNASFRLYAGPRIGFFFIPDQGYISVPSQYRSRHWEAGQYLPAWYRRHLVRYYWNYGLPVPPNGCAWVWVNNDVALIDRSDGYILDIVHNVW
ncbi:MAG: RcnB family protein [Caulobacteraceae bacterium]|nr:RcnB family protein [Caulobacteraceae bacterium]